MSRKIDMNVLAPDAGLVTRFPSNQAGRNGRALVVSSNVRMVAGRIYAAPGYERISGVPDDLSPFNLIQMLQLNQTVLVLGNSTNLYAVGPEVVFANAGPSLTVRANNYVMAGSVSGPVDASLTITWTMLYGPGSSVFADSSDPTSAVSVDTAGVYAFRLSATDGATTATSECVLDFEFSSTPFVPPTDINGPIYSLIRALDGSIYILGQFTLVDGTTVGRIARLNSDLTVDATFNSGGSGFSADPTVLSSDPTAKLVQQSDGKILVPLLNNYNGAEATTRAVRRLAVTGVIDSGFDAGSLPVPDVCAEPVYLVASGKIVVTLNGSTTTLNRVNSDGTIDGTFNTAGFDDTGHEGSLGLCIDASNRIVTNLSSQLARTTNADGTKDSAYPAGTGFDITSSPGDAVIAGALLSDRSIVFGGAFPTYNGTPAYSIARLAPDGTFNAGYGASTAFDYAAGLAGTYVFNLQAVSDDTVYAAGLFAASGGPQQNQVVKIGPTGIVDPTFVAIFDDIVWGSIIDTDGGIICYGAFNNVNSVPRTKFCKFTAAGVLL